MTFPWGEVVKTHTIEGLPTITEYIVGPSWANAGKTEFNVNTKDMGSMSFDTLDDAIIGAICDKHDSVGTATYVWRLLANKED